MALWLTALKVIPWGDVIQAAPGIVKGARKFLDRNQQTAASLPDEALAPPVADGEDALALTRRHVQRLQVQLHEMGERQQASAELIESLAEQNAKVVQAIDLLRVRTRVLLIASAAMGVTTLGLLIALLVR